MKKIVQIVSMLFISLNINAQSPNWAWVKGAGGTTNDDACSTTTDASGNVYITGFFSNNSITFGTVILTSAGGNDIYIAKYNALGNLLWAKRAGGSGQDIGYGINTDTKGNVYVAGEFRSPSIIFGTDTLTNNANSGNSPGIFIVKYDSSGNVLWTKGAKSIGNTGSGNLRGIDTDTADNVFITGSYYGPLIFGTNIINGSGVFIVKYDSEGNTIWAKGTGSVGSSNGITTDVSGNIYVTGNYSSSSIVFGVDTLINGGVYNMFIVKYDPSGNLIWANGSATTGQVNAYGIANDATGNIYVIGQYESVAKFANINLANAGYTDIFIVKYNASGNVIWAKGIGGTTYDWGFGITTDALNNVYITGHFNSSSITFGTFTLVNAGGYDIYVTKYNASGNVIWAKRAGNTSYDDSFSVTCDYIGNIYITGRYYSSSISFGTDTLINVSNSSNDADIYIAKLDILTEGIEENTHIQNTISPNPTTSFFQISNTQNIKNITIKNILGKEVYQANNINKSVVDIDITDYSAGVYFVELQSDNTTITKKIVKQ